MCVNLAHDFSLSVQLPYLFRQNMFTPSAALDISGFLSSVLCLDYDSLLQFPLKSLWVSNSHLRIKFPSNQAVFLTGNRSQMLFSNFKTWFFGTSWIGILDSTAFMLMWPNRCRFRGLWHEVEWVDTVVNSLMSHSLRGFSAENWTQRDAQEVLKEHEQYHFIRRKHLTKTQEGYSISSLSQEIRKCHCVPLSSG